MASIAREWPTVLDGTLGHRCLVLLQAAAVFEDKRTARLLDGKKVNPTLPLRRMARNDSAEPLVRN